LKPVESFVFRHAIGTPTRSSAYQHAELCPEDPRESCKGTGTSPCAGEKRIFSSIGNFERDNHEESTVFSYHGAAVVAKLLYLAKRA
jgi:hypothetical protein